MSDNPQYEYDTVEASPDALRELSRLGDELDDTQKRISDLMRKLKKAQEAETNLREVVIPEAMGNLGMRHFETTKGAEVEIEDVITAKIAKNAQSKAFAWLEKNGHGGMIRRKVITEFTQKQEKEAKKLEGKLRGTYPVVAVERAVHAGTLKKWVKGMIKDGEAFPRKLFGVFTKQVAKITKSSEDDE
jgi:hypothetical protein